MRYIVGCQYKVLLITVLLLLSLVGNRDPSKNNALAIGHSLRAVNCLNQIMQILTRRLLKSGHNQVQSVYLLSTPANEVWFAPKTV